MDLKINKDIGNEAGVNDCLYNLGIAYHKIGSFNESLKYFENYKSTIFIFYFYVKFIYLF